MKKPYDYIVFIGRFQPFHNGHLKVVKEALSKGKHIIIFIGSMYMAPNIRNPFLFEQRKKMISDALNDEGLNGKYTILGLRDYFYSANDSLWMTQVQKLVNSITAGNKNVALVGHKKDQTSYYIEALEKNIGWKYIPVEEPTGIDATTIRDKFFLKPLSSSVVDSSSLPTATINFLKAFDPDEHNRLRREYLEVEKIRTRHQRAQKELGEFPRIDQATDAIVVCAGHVLVGERNGSIGYGQVAFPGGFVNPKERLIDGCIRELREETKLKVPEPVLRGSIKNSQTYDHPLRSVRGRVITRVFYIELPDSKLPPVKGSDDLKKAYWKPIYWLQENPNLIFEDHWEIFEHLVGF